MKIGIKALRELKLEADKFKPDSYIGVATSALRTAKNGYKYAQRIESETGVIVKVISQETEANIGFAAAAANISSKDIRNIVVWDIGGGSMQISMYKGNGTFSIYQGQLAAVTFKDYIIEKIQGKNKNEIKSPNPISKKDRFAAVKYAERAANITSLHSIKSKIKKGAQVLGIGGVHYYSIKKQSKTKTKTYTIRQVEAALEKRTGLTDSEIGGDYASTEVSNLALVAGFMKGLGIKSVQTGKINLADGLLIAPEFVQKK